MSLVSLIQTKIELNTWNPIMGELNRFINLAVATLVLAFILSPIPFLDMADSDLPKKNC